MSLLLYALTAAVLLWLADRAVTPLSRGAAIVLALLPLVFTGRALLFGDVYAPIDLTYITEPLRAMREPLGVPRPHTGVISDLYAQMIPWRKAVQFALAHRQWPLWNPFILSGTVLAASAQPAAYSPFTLLACLLPIGDSLTYTAAITFFVAGLGAFLFARDLGCREQVALIAAAGWMFAHSMAFFVLWAIGGAWALFPMVLLGARRCVRDPGIRSGAILTTAFVLLLLAGHPETALHAVFAGAVYGAVECGGLPPPWIRTGAKAILTALAAGVLALLLCAVYVLPVIEAAPQTMEHAFRAGGWRSVPHGATPAESGARLLTDVFPFLNGRIWTRKDAPFLPPDSAAVGSILLAAAVYSVVRVRSRDTWFFAALALFGLLSRAAWAPLTNAMQKLPLFDLTLNDRFSFASAFALVVLAALGIEYAVKTSDRTFGRALAAATIIVAGGALLIDHARLIFDLLPEWGVYCLFAEIAGVAIAAIVALARPRALAPLLLIVVVAQRAIAAGDIVPTVPRAASYPPIPILQPLRGIAEPFRIVGVRHALVPGTSALYELEDVRGYEAMTFQRYVATYDAWCSHQPVWFNRVDDLTRPFLSFLNVRYAIAYDTLAPPEGWREVARQRGAKLLENERVLPRAFVPEAVVLGASQMDAIEALPRAAGFRERAWIEAPMKKQERDNRGNVVTRIRRQGNGLHIDAEMRTDGWVVISEPAWKGWRAYIDGRRVEHYFANVAFIGLFVPAGRHEIRLVYLPSSFVRGRAISGVTLMGLLVTTLWRRRRRS